MATYAIGDIQGCYRELQRLLEKLDFDPRRDYLWLAGDLVNRGPESLEVLRFVKALGDHAITVLGNHDLHLLALNFDKHHHFRSNASLQPILDAPDRAELIEWLRHRPLQHFDPALGVTMVHAGLPPQWDQETAVRCAREVEKVLQGPRYLDFLEHMYGNKPDRWSEDLSGWDRLRFIVNCFTRLRYCTADGTLDFRQKGKPRGEETHYFPWFEVPGRRSAGMKIVFGHWSTLGLYMGNGVCGIDTGCLWGGTLSALRLDDGSDEVTMIQCPGAVQPGKE